MESGKETKMAGKEFPESGRQRRAFRRQDLTYCTNVHPGESVSEIISNLDGFVSRVRRSRDLSEMAAGIWISARAAAELQDPGVLERFRASLRKHGLWPTSINGFPYGGFHDSRVKESVYRPDWSETARLDYTANLATLAGDLLKDAPPEFRRCAISTVPLGFSTTWDRKKHERALLNLREAALHFESVSQKSGATITLCLEMEPGCVLETTDQVLSLWNELRALAESDRQSATTGEAPNDRRFLSHLGLCYDICHQAVMFEDVLDSLRRICENRIPVFKFQISSAIEARWPQPGESAQDQSRGLLERLQAFCDDRYLHQSSIKWLSSLQSVVEDTGEGSGEKEEGTLETHRDLNPALRRIRRESLQSVDPDASVDSRIPGPPATAFPDKDVRKRIPRLRVHFHVPIHLRNLHNSEDLDEAYGLFTTRNEIERVLDFLKAGGLESPAIREEDMVNPAGSQNGDPGFAARPPYAPVLEVETYTWSVLPESLRSEYHDVVDSIIKELDYLEHSLEKRNLLTDAK